MIFGARQQGKLGEEALNIFYPLTYEEHANFENSNSYKQCIAILDQINEYGQTPKQLFKMPHIERKKMSKSEAIFYDLEGNLDNLTFINLKCDGKTLKSEVVKEIVFENELIYEKRGGGISNFKGFQLAYNKLKMKKENIDEYLNTIKNNEPSNDCTVLLELEDYIILENQLYFISYNSKMGHIELMDEKRKIIQKFEVEFKNICYLVYSNFDDYLVMGTTLGVLAIYRLKKNKNSNLKMAKSFQSESKKDFNQSLIRRQTMPNLSKSFSHRMSYSPLKSFAVSDETLSKSYEKQFCLTQRGIIRKHITKINILKFTHSYSLLLSCDASSLILITDLTNLVIIRKIRPVNLPDSFQLYPPKIRDLSICEDNSDFCVITNWFITIYTINGFLLASYQCKDKNVKFISGILVNNSSVFEDDYLITGDNQGYLKLWILVPKNNTNTKNNMSYELKNVVSINSAGKIIPIPKNPQIKRISISKDQKYITTLIDDNLYAW